jgi:hypothetical protein
VATRDIHPPKPLPVDALRAALSTSLPEQASQFGEETPEPKFLYVPTLHIKALSLDNMLVQGIRGAGKSAWWGALQSREHRRRVVRMTRATIRGIDEDTEVTPGFGTRMDPDNYPGPDILTQLLGQAEARIIWRTVIVHHVLRVHEGRAVGETWPQRVQWVKENPEPVERLLAAIEAKLTQQNRRHLILFDALDRTASNDRGRLRELLRGLLQVLLEFRSLRSIRAKAFVRPDMLLDPAVSSFPDASKVINNDVKLGWRAGELFALLWQHLGNAPEGSEAFRSACAARGAGTFSEEEGVWRIPESMQQDEHIQAAIFHAITGPYMGRSGKKPDSGKKQGVPYTWLPKHLADALGQVSPRSFLSALRHAADRSRADSPYPLHHEAVKEGVQHASGIRVTEVREDFGWVATLMEPLKGIQVPAEQEQLVELWQRSDTLRRVREIRDALAPRYLDEGYPGLIKELIELAFCERLSDSRINIPDVYRVGFGLARKGGLKPVR